MNDRRIADLVSVKFETRKRSFRSSRFSVSLHSQGYYSADMAPISKVLITFERGDFKLQNRFLIIAIRFFVRFVQSVKVLGQVFRKSVITRWRKIVGWFWRNKIKGEISRFRIVHTKSIYKNSISLWRSSKLREGFRIWYCLIKSLITSLTIDHT